MIDFANARVTDIRVTNGGSVMAVHLLTDAAREWVREHAETEGWQWLGDSTLVVEARYALPLLRGAHDDGLVVA
jgi:hypothetical protein